MPKSRLQTVVPKIIGDVMVSADLVSSQLILLPLIRQLCNFPLFMSCAALRTQISSSAQDKSVMIREGREQKAI